MRTVTHCADPIPAMATAAVLMLTASAVGKVGMFTLVMSHLWVQLFKRHFCRARPALPIGIASLVKAPDRFSFPSGHSAAAASMAYMLAATFPALAPLVLAFAVIVGLSRCYLGVHYPGDVVAGWTLATIAYYLAALIL